MNVDVYPILRWLLRVGDESATIQLSHFAPIGAHAVDHVRAGIYQSPEPLLAFAQSITRDSNFLGRFLLRVNVQTATYIAFKCSIRRESGEPVIKDPPVLTAVMSQPIFHFEWLAGVKGRDVNLQAAVKVLWVHILGPAVAHFLLHCAPNKVQPAFIEVVAQLVYTREPDHHRSGVSNSPELLFAFAQSLLSLFALRDVTCKPGEVMFVILDVFTERDFKWYLTAVSMQTRQLCCIPIQMLFSSRDVAIQAGLM